MRNISFFLTQDQIRRRIKTVTRRVGWGHATAGMLVQPIVKGQGLKAGETIERIGGPIKIISTGAEVLSLLIEDTEYGAAEAAREGFPGWTGQQFVDFICKQPGIYPGRALNRIEFSYVE